MRIRSRRNGTGGVFALLVGSLSAATAMAAAPTRGPGACVPPTESLPTSVKSDVDRTADLRIKALVTGGVGWQTTKDTEYVSQVVSQDDLFRRWMLYELCESQTAGRITPEMYQYEQYVLTFKEKPPPEIMARIFPPAAASAPSPAPTATAASPSKAGCTAFTKIDEFLGKFKGYGDDIVLYWDPKSGSGVYASSRGRSDAVTISTRGALSYGWTLTGDPVNVAATPYGTLVGDENVTASGWFVSRNGVDQNLTNAGGVALDIASSLGLMSVWDAFLVPTSSGPMLIATSYASGSDRWVRTYAVDASCLPH